MRWTGALSIAVVALVGVGSCGGRHDETGIADPGTVTLHRLNRAEYNHTVRDLFLTSQTPADDFPADDFAFGFSNIADVLSISPLHLEMYETAADSLLGEISTHHVAPESTTRVEAELGTGVTPPPPPSEDDTDSVAAPVDPGSVQLVDDQKLTVSFSLAYTGVYTLTVAGGASNLGELELDLDNGSVTTWLLDGTESVDVTLSAGDHTATAFLLNPDPSAKADLAPSVSVDALQLAGPHGLSLPPGPGRAAIFTCDPAPYGEAECAERIVRDFGRKAWRRPLTNDEFDSLMALYGDARNSGSTWEDGVLLALKGAMLSPFFTYRVEADGESIQGAARPLNDWELASRLSYFLWASMPDEELLDLADKNELHAPEVIEQQVDRMLADPKAEGLIDTLGTEWLYLDSVDEAAPDVDTFSAFDEDLRASMKTELDLFAKQVLLSDRSMMELVNGRDTFVDARLAAEYGIPAPAGDGFSAVHIQERPGIFGRAGWLTALSYPTRTSPVRRGSWVLANMLCEAPPPPPGNIPPLEAAASDTGPPVSIQEQMQVHESDPLCASCHVVMDGIGFSMEHFDGIGEWRDVDVNGLDVIAKGVLSNGATFDGAEELGDTLAADPATPRCMAQKVFTFALGRPPRVEDIAFLARIEQQFEAGGFRFSALAKGIATSVPFRYRTGEPSVEAP